MRFLPVRILRQIRYETASLAVFTGHKLRQHPHGSGSCLVGVSRWDQELADAGIRLLEELRYWGVSQVEFKRDEQTLRGVEISRGQLDAGEWLRSYRGMRVDGVLTPRDPLPGIVDVGRVVKRIALRQQRRKKVDL